MDSSYHPCLLLVGRSAVDSGVLEAELAREQCALLETRTRVVESVAHSHGGSTVPQQFMGVATTRGPRYVKVAAFVFDHSSVFDVPLGPGMLADQRDTAHANVC
jgi:hypothetical protein